MPEIVTQHPDIVLGLLKDANLRCGTGDKQQILISCPKDRFCALPKGELCVYGVKELPQMTQIHAHHIFLLPSVLFYLVLYSVIIFLLGLFIGTTVKK